MTITIKINTGNAAFENDKTSHTHTETARILAGIAQRFDTDGPFEGPLFDVNGNTVGSVRVEGK